MKLTHSISKYSIAIFLTAPLFLVGARAHAEGSAREILKEMAGRRLRQGGRPGQAATRRRLPPYVRRIDSKRTLNTIETLP